MSGGRKARVRPTNAALLLVAVAIGARTVGCASAEPSLDEPLAPEGDADSGSVVDAAAPEGEEAAVGEGAAPSPRCSADGWCRVDMPSDRVSLFGIWGSSAGDVWTVGSSGAVFHWNGNAWGTHRLLTDAGQQKPLFGVWGSGPNDVWVFAADEIRHSDGWNDAGTGWSTFELAGKTDKTLISEFRAVWGSSATDVWAVVGSTGLVSAGVLQKCLRSEGWNGDTTALVPVFDYFKQHTPGTNFHAVWGSGPNDVWLAGDNGRIFHTDGYWGNMAEWRPQNSNTRARLTRLWGTAPDDAWAIGEIGTIRHWTYNEGGELYWAPSESTTTSTLRAIWGSSANDVWVVGDDSTILHGDGATWSRVEVPVPPGTPLYGVWGSGADDVWVVGERVILRRGASGATK
ncbi:MAG: hypothetical protein KF764_25390 [Labilithrix sp.]|nr:hypothetical protein [Labilithrix sp.]